MFGGAGGFSDFFESIFGGMGQQAAGARRRQTGAASGSFSPVRGQDFEQEVEITLEEAFQGAQRLMDVDGRRLEIKIPAGVKTGSRVRMAGEGGPSARGGAPGDIYLLIKVLPHPVFERQGDNLHSEVPVDMFIALLGGEVRVPTLTGNLVLRIPPGTQAGRTFRLSGQGMPKLKSGERGDLLVKVRVMLPDKLSEREQELVREWARLRGVIVPGP
jgi:DnaJ-class molecular chaperone